MTSTPATLTVVARPLLRARFVAADGAVELTLTGSPGHNCAIEISTNFSNWSAWTNLANSTGQSVLTDQVVPQSRRFYRAQVTD